MLAPRSTTVKLLIIGVFLLSFITLLDIRFLAGTQLKHFAATFSNITLDAINSANKVAGDVSDITSLHNLTNSELTRIRHAVNCDSHQVAFSVGQRGDHLVLYNYIKANKNFACHESITFTAPADFTFLDNLPTLVDRWRGPISVALYVPGDDFEVTLRSIAYLRLCAPNRMGIRDLVTFHLFFHQGHVPNAKVKPLMDVFKKTNYSTICDSPAPYKDVKPKDTYRRKHNLLFPINAARNIARQTSQTHYVFAADIELYPSLNFISQFMKMLSVHPEYVRGERPRIFVLPIFEIDHNATVPDNKTALRAELEAGKAQLFHKKICAPCHSIPNFNEWRRTKETEELDVFTVGKRVGKHNMWEAFYIGTKDDPLFDEHYSWEGQGNKMSQGYAMCLLDYDYMVLNNAFIIHKPGIKHEKEQLKSFGSEVQKSNGRMKKVTKPMLIAVYGNRKGCAI